MPINRVIISTAAPSHTIVQQQSVWTNTLLSTIKKSARFVVIRVGLNDLGPPESAATALGRYQTLVNTVAADAPQARIYTATMTPCKARLITLLGAIAGATAYQKWLDMNEAISGGGGIPITGMYGVITAHTDQLNDGAGNLVAAYDEGDGIHPKNAGRRIIALRYIDKLSIDGTLQGP
jgi:lysophospholipase L1-like esterase